MNKYTFLPSTLILTLVVALVTVLSPLNVAADTPSVKTVLYDFEDSDTSAWHAMGNGVLSIDTKNYYSGASSLKITGRKNFFNGPAIDTTDFFIANEVYSVSAYLYHEGLETLHFKATARLTDKNDEISYKFIGETDVSPGSWTSISGSFTVPENYEDCKESSIYLECGNETIDFYVDYYAIKGLTYSNIDDIPQITQSTQNTVSEVKKTTANEKTVQVLEKDNILMGFEDEKYNKLFSIKNAKKEIVNSYSYSGRFSLFVSNRTSSADALEMKADFLEKNKTYSYGTYLMYNSADAPEEINFYTVLQYKSNGKNFTEKISSDTVSKNTWSKISCTFKLPAKAENVLIFIYSENSSEQLHKSYLTDFYIDNVSLKTTTLSKSKKILVPIIIVAVCILVVLVFIKLIPVWKKKKSSQKELIELSLKDAMTKTLNRNAYQQFLSDISSDTKKVKLLHIAICDINFLKYINDNISHKAGDEAICKCASLLLENVAGDVFRTGGDEFICISFAPFDDKLKKAISDASCFEENSIFSVAIGFAEYNQELDGDTPDIKLILERADQEMYKDKKLCKEQNPKLCRDNKENKN